MLIPLMKQQRRLIAEVADSGQGFNLQDEADYDRLGLVGMRERVELLGGQFELHSSPGHGTTIRARLPPNNSRGR